MTGRAATPRRASEPSLRASRAGCTATHERARVRGPAARHGALPIDRHSTRVPEVTPTHGEPMAQGIDRGLPRSTSLRPGVPGWIRTNATTLRRTGEPMPPSDLLSALLDPVRAAVRKDSAEALNPGDAPATRSVPPLVDRRALARALGVCTATVDRMCRAGRIPGVHVGDLRRFDVGTVVAPFWATSPGAVNAPRADPHADAGPRRSIGPGDAVKHAWCWLVGSARHEEHVREGASSHRRDGRRSRRGIGTAGVARISTDRNGCEERRSPQPS
jgi:hypothetical protein